MTSAPDVEALRRRRPEWAPWLAVVEEVLREIASPAWDAMVPAEGVQPRPATPLLAGTVISVQPKVVQRLLDRLIRTASTGDTPNMKGLRAAQGANLDAVEIFEASLSPGGERISGIASAAGIDPEAFQAVVALVPVPFLHACRQRWATLIPESWVEGFCPACGSWPAFTEVRGIERSRFFRCGRCGSDWYARFLHCAYCGQNDHEQLTSLVPENGSTQAVVEACRRCRGYVKAFTKLQGCAPAAVMLEDLATVDLDVAAVQQGYERPAGAGSPLNVTVQTQPGGRRFFAWNT